MASEASGWTLPAAAFNMTYIPWEAMTCSSGSIDAKLPLATKPLRLSLNYTPTTYSDTSVFVVRLGKHLECRYEFTFFLPLEPGAPHSLAGVLPSLHAWLRVL